MTQDLVLSQLSRRKLVEVGRSSDGPAASDVVDHRRRHVRPRRLACAERGGIANIRIVDQAPEGYEGPWVTYARMETLRSPKTLLGPALGMASLTFRAWFTALHGEAEWEELFRIPRPMWMEYLKWYREVMQIPVENDTHVTRIMPRPDGLIELQIAGGERPSILTRNVVMATGRDGLGEPTIPGFVEGLERHQLWAHSADPIDFDRLKGKRVVVIGVGASAVDNAAEALEAGAGEVRLLARRKQCRQINKLMGIGSYGVTAGFAKIDPEWRWRLMDYSTKQQTPAPHNSTLRVSRPSQCLSSTSIAVSNSMKEEDGEVVITTINGRVFSTDFVILGTGFSIDPVSRAELDPLSGQIACWEDRYIPPVRRGKSRPRQLSLAGGRLLLHREGAGAAPWLKDIHCFNYGSSVSIGKVSGDIPAISEGALWLARGIAASLFIARYRPALAGAARLRKT
ncbi:MAG: NAD(P)/FAD-dependent oxidoreductase [Micropruina sp.]|uniref:NAD(P)-binding domain-containing protein n=1 Tax=Micropruina sp. TaxID=2737536 RepID=UPI0039E4570E